MGNPSQSIVERCERAFTLIEVLVALAIAGIAVVGLMRLHLFSLAAADKSEKMIQAISIAQNKIVELEAAGSGLTGPLAGDVETNHTTFHWRTEVSDLPLSQGAAGDADRLHKVEVTVGWDQGLGRKDVSLCTLLDDRRRP